MGYINVYVSKDAHVFVKNNQLFLENREQKVDYPLEDLNCVLIENLNTTISTYTLSQFASFGILCFICNQNHLPSGVVLPFCEHYQTLSVFQNQISASKPLQKQLWQKIVMNKIKNQNEVLNICGSSDKLKDLQESVLSGDSGNNEAKASLIYFKELFGKNFIRRDDTIGINACLNYGYSIVRGFVARSIVMHGMQPFLGINHCNQLNQFNLADDLMEIFRPVVDLYVKIYLSGVKELTPKIKAELLNLLNYDVLIDGQKQTVSYAIELFVQSFQKSLKESKVCLKEVDITRLEMHNYE